MRRKENPAGERIFMEYRQDGKDGAESIDLLLGTMMFGR
jgi:hypothetical protein